MLKTNENDRRGARNMFTVKSSEFLAINSQADDNNIVKNFGCK